MEVIRSRGGNQSPLPPLARLERRVSDMGVDALTSPDPSFLALRARIDILERACPTQKKRIARMIS